MCCHCRRENVELPKSVFSRVGVALLQKQLRATFRLNAVIVVEVCCTENSEANPNTSCSDMCPFISIVFELAHVSSLSFFNEHIGAVV